MIDGTYRVNRQKFPLYTIMVKDGNGNGQAVAQALLADEKRPTLEEFFSLYKQSLPDAAQVKIIIVDKDFNEVAVLRSLWPEVDIALCRFHVQKTFRLQIQNLHLPGEESDSLKRICQQLVYAVSEEAYNKVLVDLVAQAPRPFVDYFQKNWDCCREMWSFYLVRRIANYETFTTNFVESRHQKLKQRLKPTHSLPECLKEVIAFQLGQEEIAREKNTTLNLKRQYKVGEDDEVRRAIKSVSTPLAGEIMSKQMNHALKCSSTATVQKLPSGVLRVKFPTEEEEKVSMTESETPSCSCSFHHRQELPCRHIFIAAWQTGCEVFQESWVPPRWMKCHQMPELPKTYPKPSLTVSTVQSPSTQSMSKTQKYREVNRLLKVIADVCSDLGFQEFTARYELLERLLTLWTSGVTVALVEVLDKDPPGDADMAERWLDACATPAAPNQAATGSCGDGDVAQLFSRVSEKVSPQKLDASSDVRMPPGHLAPAIEERDHDHIEKVSSQKLNGPDEPSDVRMPPGYLAPAINEHDPDHAEKVSSLKLNGPDEPSDVRMPPGHLAPAIEEHDPNLAEKVSSQKLNSTDETSDVRMPPGHLAPAIEVHDPDHAERVSSQKLNSTDETSDVRMPPGHLAPAIEVHDPDHAERVFSQKLNSTDETSDVRMPPGHLAPAIEEHDPNLAEKVSSQKLNSTDETSDVRMPPGHLAPAIEVHDPDHAERVSSQKLNSTDETSDVRMPPGHLAPAIEEHDPNLAEKVSSQKLNSTDETSDVRMPPGHLAPAIEVHDPDHAERVSSQKLNSTDETSDVRMPPGHLAPAIEVHDPDHAERVSSQKLNSTDETSDVRMPPGHLAPAIVEHDPDHAEKVSSQKLKGPDEPSDVRMPPGKAQEPTSGPDCLHLPSDMQLLPGKAQKPASQNLFPIFTLPAAVRPRGRPKGVALNAIGLQKAGRSCKKRKAVVTGGENLKKARTSAPSVVTGKRKADQSTEKSCKKLKSPPLTVSKEQVESLLLLVKLKRYSLPVSTSFIQQCRLENHPSQSLCDEVNQQNQPHFDRCFDYVAHLCGSGYFRENRKETTSYCQDHILVTALLIRAKEIGVLAEDLLPTLEQLPVEGMTLDALAARIPKKQKSLAIGPYTLSPGSLKTLKPDGLLDDQVMKNGAS